MRKMCEKIRRFGIRENTLLDPIGDFFFAIYGEIFKILVHSA